MTAAHGTTQETWFGPVGSPLFGVWHLPAGGRSDRVVVIAPPVGIEMFVAHRALRTLADRLAARGVAALRFDYRATGHSAGGPEDGDEVGGWRDSLDEAVRYARELGTGHVSVVGLRLGATLAASVRERVDALVLWDPLASGARFLREEEMVFRVGVPAAPTTDGSGGVYGPGARYGAETVADLREVTLTSLLQEDGSGVRDGLGRVLVVSRADSPPRRGVREVAAAPGVEAVALPGQDALFDWRTLTVPEATIEHVAGWLAAGPGGTDRVLDPALRTDVVVATTSDGLEVHERAVRVGASELFGVLSWVEGRAGSGLVFTNAAPPAVSVGPARMWVELARRHAEHGPALRFDGRGTGESDGAFALTYPAVYVDGVVADIVDAVRWMRARSVTDVAVAGLCAASWAALRAADREPVDRVHALNPSVWDVRPGGALTSPWPPPADGASAGGPPAARAGAARKARRLARELARAVLPQGPWAGLAHRGLVEAPAGLLLPLLRAGTDVHLLLGEREAERYGRLGAVRRPRGAGSGRVVIRHAAEVDHALMSAESRSIVRSLLDPTASPGA